MSLDRELLATRSKNHKLRKNEKDFLFFWKKACFSNSWLQKSSKFLAKKEVSDKNHIISERSEDGLSSYVFISILKFLTKIDFFWGEEGLKTWHGVIFNAFHTLYHPCSFVRISASFQHLSKIFLQDSQKLDN